MRVFSEIAYELCVKQSTRYQPKKHHVGVHLVGYELTLAGQADQEMKALEGG